MTWNIVAGARADDGGVGLTPIPVSGTWTAALSSSPYTVDAGFPKYLDPADGVWKTGTSAPPPGSAWLWDRSYTHAANGGPTRLSRTGDLSFSPPVFQSNSGVGGAFALCSASSSSSGGCDSGAPICVPALYFGAYPNLFELQEYAAKSFFSSTPNNELTIAPHRNISIAYAVDVLSASYRVRVVEIYDETCQFASLTQSPKTITGQRIVEFTYTDTDLIEVAVFCSVQIDGVPSRATLFADAMLTDPPSAPFVDGGVASTESGVWMRGVLALDTESWSWVWTPDVRLEWIVGGGVPQQLSAYASILICDSVYTARADCAVTAYDPALCGATQARAIVRMGGVEVTDRILGALTVDIEEGAARLSEMDWLPIPGDLALSGLVGVPVEVDVWSRMGGAEMSHRLFTGRVTSHSRNMDTGVIHLVCSDGLQRIMDAMTPEAIALSLPASQWSVFLFDALSTGWRHAQERLSTWPGCLDLDAYGVARATPWAAAMPFRVVGESAPSGVVDASITVDLVESSELLNQVSITWSYRYPRLVQRRMRFEWDADAGWGASNHPVMPMSSNACSVNYRGTTVPTRAMIESAAASAGWRVVGEHYVQCMTRNPAGFYGICALMPSPPELICYCAIDLESRYAQTITEVYTLTVAAPSSVSAAGLAPGSASYSGQSDFADSVWESDAAMPPVAAMSSPGEVVFSGAIGSHGRAAADAAIRCAIQIARTRILSSHRHRVDFTVAFDPLLDVDKTLRIATRGIHATGKIAQVKHTLDFVSGSYSSEVVMRPSGISPETPMVYESPLVPPLPPDMPAADGTGLSVQGITQYSWPVFAPDAPPDYALDGYVSNSPDYGYNTRFRITTPGVPATHRDALTLPSTATYVVAIPEDELVLTQP